MDDIQYDTTTATPLADHGLQTLYVDAHCRFFVATTWARMEPYEVTPLTTDDAFQWCHDRGIETDMIGVIYVGD